MIPSQLILIFLLVIVAYLFGSLSSAIIVCKLMRLPDPRSVGSRNPGATNVLRVGGKFPAILTLMGDILKGVIPVLIAKALGLGPIGLSLVTLAAFLGHLFPIFFGFEGGKGVATGIGCIIALSWPTALALIGIWILAAILFRYSSLASLIATASSPFLLYYFTHEIALTLTLFLIAAILFWRHRHNINKLIHGTESKIKLRKR